MRHLQAPVRLRKKESKLSVCFLHKSSVTLCLLRRSFSVLLLYRASPRVFNMELCFYLVICYCFCMPGLHHLFVIFKKYSIIQHLPHVFSCSWVHLPPQNVTFSWEALILTSMNSKVAICFATFHLLLNSLMCVQAKTTSWSRQWSFVCPLCH